MHLYWGREAVPAYTGSNSHLPTPRSPLKVTSRSIDAQIMARPCTIPHWRMIISDAIRFFPFFLQKIQPSSQLVHHFSGHHSFNVFNITIFFLQNIFTNFRHHFFLLYLFELFSAGISDNCITQQVSELLTSQKNSFLVPFFWCNFTVTCNNRVHIDPAVLALKVFRYKKKCKSTASRCSLKCRTLYIITFHCLCKYDLHTNPSPHPTLRACFTIDAL